MDEQTSFLALIANRLDALEIAYMISGSVALNVYAEPRMTRDVDVVVDLHEDDVEPFVAAFERDCYVDRDVVREAVRRRDMFNVIHNEWILKADFVIRKASAYRVAELERRRHITVGDVTLAIVAPEDLLLSKLVWGAGMSELQQRDVEKLVQHVRDLDWDYVEHWARVLGVADAVAQLRGAT